MKRSKKNLKSRQVTQSRRRNVAFYGVSLIVLGVLSLVLFVQIMNRPFLHITGVEVTGVRAVSPDKVFAIVEDNLTGKKFHVYRSNWLLFPRGKITNDIKQQLPRIEEVKIRNKKNKYIVNVSEYDPAYLWCVDVQKDCYYTTPSGYIFDRAPIFSDPQYVGFVGSDRIDPIGTYILEKDSFEHIKGIFAHLQDAGLDIAWVMFQEETDINVYVKTIGEHIFQHDVYIKVNYRHSVAQIMQALDATLRTDEFADQLDVIPELLEYVDLRFDNKIFYKFTEVEEEG